MIKKRNLNDSYFDQFNYELYGGTPILGINSNVMIAHGKSSALAFKNMLVLSKDIIEANLNEKIKTVFQ
jgi:glycerol-3-phosphate acyltransferase PlsX